MAYDSGSPAAKRRRLDHEDSDTMRHAESGDWVNQLVPPETQLQYCQVPQQLENMFTEAEDYDNMFTAEDYDNMFTEAGDYDNMFTEAGDYDNMFTEAEDYGNMFTETEDYDIVCFGMICGLGAECKSRTRTCASPGQTSSPVTLDTARGFSSPSDAGFRGRVSDEHADVLQALLESSLKLQVSCILDTDEQNDKKRSKILPSLHPCSLSIILYGPAELFDELGEFFQQYDIYLQDPHDCELNVRYRNPHRLSSADLSSCPMTSELGSRTVATAFNLEDAAQQPDLLAILNSQVDVPEAPQPEAIETTLQPHQKQALTFMLRREQGWAFEKDRPEVWDVRRMNQGYVFINRVSDAHQREEPPQFRGGIIADPMGLGKTLSMIALTATDLPGYSYEEAAVGEGADEGPPDMTTLIVVPPPLLDTWEEQLARHVGAGKMRWSRHHGKSRILDAVELENFNLVLTTYHTVSAEWKGGSNANTSVLFLTTWRRVILDEAHFIRNHGSRMAKAVCAIKATSRWAVTGTPIQNRLGDLAALLKFLRVYPYGDTKRFEADVSHLWKTGKSDEAVRRLKRLTGCILLRRPKETINLPPRRDLRCVVEFDDAERSLYDEIKTQTIALKDTALRTADPVRPVTLVNFVQQINSLRLICNMGLHYQSRHSHDLARVDPLDASSWDKIAQHAFNFHCEAGTVVCRDCSASLDLTDALLGASWSLDQPRFAECLRFVCADCVHKSGKPISCGHSPAHPIAPVSVSSAILEEIRDMPSQSYGAVPSALPSKIASLLEQLKAHPPGIKCVVFSSWRMTLDVIEAGLKASHIRYLRFDGKVPQKDRQGIIDRFRTDPSVKVMILTLSCGAVGLTLTEASYAYLMEPHWNPTIEEQALTRIHRIGQTREVTTIRFLVRDTFEERVVEVQQAKRDLEKALFSPIEGNQGGDAGKLEWLCSLL